MSSIKIEEFKMALTMIRESNVAQAIEFMDTIFNTSVNKYSIVRTNNIIIVNEWEYIDEISFCEKKVNEIIDTFDAYLAMSMIFKMVGNDERRQMFLEKALKKNSNNHRIWRELAETSYIIGDISKALHCFKEAINFKSDDIYSLEGLGLCYYYMDEPIKAISPLKKAISLDPFNHSILNHLAFILSEIGELDEAHSCIQKALELDENNNIYLDTYACILFLQEKYMIALKVFEKILSNNPKEWELSWDILTKLYSILGLHAKAKQSGEKFNINELES